MPESAPGRISALDIVRAIVLLAALATFAIWGFTAWPSPWSFVIGIGLPVVVLLLWAVLLSPRPILHAHPFVRAIIELLVYAGATAAWWSMGETWIGIGFAVVAIATGLATGLRSLR